MTVRELVAIALDPKTESKSEATRIAAVKELLDRGFGRPSQALQHCGAVGRYDPIKFTDEELDAEIERLERAVGLHGEQA